ncbi:hypothetical protein PAXRUDRAFT_821149 [Paxillus rubicundulus Ve08.2h10]|uniref:Monopolin complex subunit Csm1/Pcs1 C-terminal domain-containing protein n=1 Tax=Paxillus rubicundulus Ve08.2h10 TaxID=930991 RepID=A0A0D0EB56_9AGAM|nr:hypothetical protein PAXRUDRAFT_821149 [Paxillus rubicundulus Ve08.2h10]
MRMRVPSIPKNAFTLARRPRQPHRGQVMHPQINPLRNAKQPPNKSPMMAMTLLQLIHLKTPRLLPRGPAVNGHKEKGKDKAPNPKTSKKVASPEVPMEIDEAQGVEESEVDAPARTRPIPAAGMSKNHTPSDINRKELERWKQKANTLETQRDALSKQLEELFQIRKTDPEEAFEQLHLQYEERAKTQDALIKELTSQLARIEPLARTGQGVALHFLTREAADEEKRMAEQDVSRLEEIIKRKDSTLAEKTKRIAELEQLVQDANHERDAEIERSKELLARAAPKGTPSNPRSNTRRPFGTDDPKMTEVIKFYEDMSNLLVTNVKFEVVPDSEEPEILFHCIYTYFEMTRRADDIEGERIGEKSIVFTMRIFNGFGGPNGEPASEDDFIHRRIRYTPLHLDNEPDSFIKGLEYMADSFTFPSSQQGLFLNSLREKIRDIVKDASEFEVEVEEIDGEER